ncbi:MAG: hypothetical protein PVJ64_08585 [Gemmatimonadales bacterium]|jgi:hypothetical protein
MRQRRGILVFLFAGSLAAVAIGGCQDEAATGPEVTGVQLAKPGSQDPEVTGTDPTGAPQDTTLDVEVSGSGFDDGSTVEMTLSGVPTEKVRTNSTRYRSPRKLIANITIAADAQVDFYDVEVTTSSRKKGIGTEMFEVFVGGGNEVMVEFKQPESGELGGFFSAVATLDYASAQQPVQGKHNENNIETKFSPFTLSLEPRAEFYDGKDPYNDPLCETEFLETILDAAAANGGSLDGSLEIEAQWDHPISILIGVRFIVAVDKWEYKITIPQPGSPGQDRLIQTDDERTILAIRDGHFQIRRRKLGRKGTWWEMEQCFVDSDLVPSNGLMDLEIWVWK